MNHLSIAIMIGAVAWSAHAQAQGRRRAPRPPAKAAKPAVKRASLSSRDVARALKTPASRYSTKTEKLRALRVHASGVKPAFELNAQQTVVRNRGWVVMTRPARVDGRSGSVTLTQASASRPSSISLSAHIAAAKRFLVECKVEGQAGMSFRLSSLQQSAELVLQGRRGQRVSGKVLGYFNAQNRGMGLQNFTLKLGRHTSQSWFWKGCEITPVSA